MRMNKTKILKQTTLSDYQYKTRKQTVKLGRELEISYARNRLFDLKNGNQTTLTTQHHNMTYTTWINEMNDVKKLKQINKLYKKLY